MGQQVKAVEHQLPEQIDDAVKVPPRLEHQFAQRNQHGKTFLAWRCRRFGRNRQRAFQHAAQLRGKRQRLRPAPPPDPPQQQRPGAIKAAHAGKIPENNGLSAKLALESGQRPRQMRQRPVALE